jgi:hypothetical protein
LIAHSQRERDRVRVMFDASAMSQRRRIAAERTIDDVASTALAWWSSNE